jgi:Arm DNA-binding domain
MEEILANINFKVRLGKRTGTSKRVIYSFQAANKSLKEFTFWDRDLPGFGMRVYRSGRRSYFIQYRERRDNRKHSIGDADNMDPRMARRKARELLSKVKLGFGVVDPLAVPEKIGTMRFGTFAQLFFDRYAHHWSARVRESEQRRCALHVVPFFSSKLLVDIERADILRWRDGLVDKAATANRLLPTLSSIFKAAEQLGLRSKGCNPCANIGRLKTRARDQFLSVADIARLGVTLKAHEDRWPQDCAVVRLLLLTGAQGRDRNPGMGLAGWGGRTFAALEDRTQDAVSGRAGARRFGIPAASQGRTVRVSGNGRHPGGQSATLCVEQAAQGCRAGALHSA